jgi:hypothetical protein
LRILHDTLGLKKSIFAGFHTFCRPTKRPSECLIRG